MEHLWLICQLENSPNGTKIEEIEACNCPACRTTVMQDAEIQCANYMENKNEMNLYLEITQNPMYAGLAGFFIYIIGIFSVIAFLACRRRCRRVRNMKHEKKLAKRAHEEAYIAEIRAERNSVVGSTCMMSPRTEMKKCQRTSSYQDNYVEMPKPLQRTLSVRSQSSLPQYHNLPYFNTEPIYRQFRDCESPRREIGATPRRIKTPRRLILEQHHDIPE
jgi:hypothetical protein